jgi:alcohol dehydrogenase class IV
MDVFVGRGSAEKLDAVLGRRKSVLLFTGNKSFERIKHMVLPRLARFDVTRYSDFDVNPKEEDLQRALAALHPPFDAIVACGGGSVIDFAKLYKHRSKSDAFFSALPTTAGTGSEATCFAVYYAEGGKHSLEDVRLLPDCAIVDSRFSCYADRKVRAATACDAFIQAVESYWSVRATDASRAFAEEAIHLCKANIVRYVRECDEGSADGMARAAHLSGKAINISRTTAAHALSYVFTGRFGIPHGQAAALSINALVRENCRVNKENLNDPCGVAAARETMRRLVALLGSEDYFSALFREIELETNLVKLKIYETEELVREVNMERLVNNPRSFTTNELAALFDMTTGETSRHD